MFILEEILISEPNFKCGNKIWFFYNLKSISYCLKTFVQVHHYGNRYEASCLRKSIKQLAKGGPMREFGANRLSAPRYQLVERYVGFGKMIEKEKIVQTTRKKFGYGVLWVVRPQRERPRPAHYTILSIICQ